jgi:hypothetical protein
MLPPASDKLRAEVASSFTTALMTCRLQLRPETIPSAPFEQHRDKSVFVRLRALGR